MQFDVNNWIKNWEEEERVRCPYCSYDVSEDRDSIILYENGVSISYHGWPDAEDNKIECPDCGENFKVREHVRRTYDTCRIDEDF